MKQVIVVCDHGHSSRFVAEFLRREFDKRGEEIDVMAAGVLAKVPTDYDLNESMAVVTAFDQAQTDLLKKAGFPDNYLQVWQAFFKRVKDAGKPLFAYQDYEKHVFVEPRELAARILEAAP